MHSKQCPACADYVACYNAMKMPWLRSSLVYANELSYKHIMNTRLTKGQFVTVRGDGIVTFESGHVSD